LNQQQDLSRRREDPGQEVSAVSKGVPREPAGKDGADKRNPCEVLMKYFSFIIGALLVAAFAISDLGCDHSSSFVNMDRYYIYQPANLKQTFKHGEQYFVQEVKDVDLTFTLFGYKDFLAIPLVIRNKTGSDIKPEDYGISLYDGRDLKPITMITKDELCIAEKKMLYVKDFNLLNPSVQGAVSAIDSLIDMPANASLGDDIDGIINNYFEFRPIYAKSAREGYLVFFHDFNLEYPVTLRITLNGEDKYFYFMPRSFKNEK
jgi:hypothetical protein